ncbi:MAG: SAVED domain-containing protein [Cellvibrionaceae bacterium]
MKIFNAVSNLIIQWFKLKIVHPVVAVGRIIFTAGMVGGLGLVISSTIKDVPIAIEFSSGSGMLLSLVAVVVGMITMIYGATLSVKSCRSEIIYLQGLPASAPSIPDSALGKPYSLHGPHSTVLKVSDESPEKAISDLNGACKSILEHALINQNYDKIFFAGFARIPCIFSIAAMFRGCGVDVEALERFKSPAKWARLSDFDTVEKPEISLSDDISSYVSEGREVGIAISITGDISSDELPDYISKHTKIFQLSPKVKNEAFTVKSHLDDFAMEFKELIDALSKRADIIHLFISAQSALVFALGRMYQEGMHSKIVVHNYSPDIRQYSWAVQIDNGDVSLYTRE